MSLTVEALQNKFASRKLAIATLGLVLSAGLLAFDLIEGGQFIQALTICVGGYLAANVWQGK